MFSRSFTPLLRRMSTDAAARAALRKPWRVKLAEPAVRSEVIRLLTTTALVTLLARSLHTKYKHNEALSEKDAEIAALTAILERLPSQLEVCLRDGDPAVLAAVLATLERVTAQAEVEAGVRPIQPDSLVEGSAEPVPTTSSTVETPADPTTTDSAGGSDGEQPAAKGKSTFY